VFVAVTVGVLLWISRPDGGSGGDGTDNDLADAPSTTAEALIDPSPPTTASVSTSDFEGVSAWTPQDGILTSPVRADFGWFAMQGPRSGGRLVRSTDGLRWDTVSSNLPESSLLRVRREADGTYRSLVLTPDAQADGRFEISRWSSVDGAEWEVQDAQAFAGDGRAFAIFGQGDVTLVLSESGSRAPVPAVSAVLGEFVDADLADRTCAIDSDGLLHYILLDCEGNELARLDNVERADDDRIAFAGQVLGFRYTVHVSIDGAPSEPVLLPPATSLVGISAAENGFLALVIDATAAIADPVLALTVSLSADLRRWETGEGFTPIDSAPVQGQPFGDQLLPGPGDRVYLSKTEGLFAAEPPYEDWSIVAEGPNGEIARGSEIRVLRGTNLLTFSDLNAGRIWIGREGEDWTRVDVPDGVVFEAVLAHEDYVVFRDFRGTRNELLRVELDQLAVSG
jgi:hypothetical protein